MSKEEREGRTRKNANETQPSHALLPLATSPCCSRSRLPIAPAAAVPASPPMVVRKSRPRWVHQVERRTEGGGIGSAEGGRSLREDDQERQSCSSIEEYQTSTKSSSSRRSSRTSSSEQKATHLKPVK